MIHGRRPSLTKISDRNARIAQYAPANIH